MEKIDPIVLQQEQLSYKLRNSNDFTLSFALMELSEFLHQYGFEKAFPIVQEMDNRVYQQRAIGILYEFAKNHCTRWEDSYSDLIEFMLKGWVR